MQTVRIESKIPKPDNVSERKALRGDHAILAKSDYLKGLPEDSRRKEIKFGELGEYKSEQYGLNKKLTKKYLKTHKDKKNGRSVFALPQA
jgi:hypothetical protein